MRAGDYVCFPAGQKAGHCLVNNGASVCRYVMVGENNPNEVCVYTDSNKVLVRSLGRRAIFDMAAVRHYWHGEDTGVHQGAREPGPVDAADTSPPKRPISSATVDWTIEGEGPKFGGRSKHLTYAAVGGPNYHVGMLIERPSDVEPALREAIRLKDRTVFLDIRTDPTENVWPMVQAGKGITEMLLGSEDL